MGLPKSAMSIFGLFIIVAWLTGLLYGSVNPQQKAIDEANQQLLNNLGNSLTTNTTTQSSLPIVGDSLNTISMVFGIIFNLLGLTFGFLASMVMTFFLFIYAMTGIPVLISGIFISLISVGLIFALLSKIIDR